MKISEFYQQSAILSLNSSIAALIPAFTLMSYNLLILKIPELMILILPFLLYSLGCFHMFLWRKTQSVKSNLFIQEKEKVQPSFLESSNFLITNNDLNPHAIFFYHYEGILVGELREKVIPLKEKLTLLFSGKRLFRQYDCLDQEETVIGKFLIHDRKRIIDVYDHNDSYLGSYQNPKYSQHWNRSSKLVRSDGKEFGTIKSFSLFQDDQIIQNGKLVARLRKGWLPVEWQKTFIDSNLPVMYIHPKLSQAEKLVCLSLLVKEFV